MPKLRIGLTKGKFLYRIWNGYVSIRVFKVAGRAPPSVPYEGLPVYCQGLLSLLVLWSFGLVVTSENTADIIVLSVVQLFCS